MDYSKNNEKTGKSDFSNDLHTIDLYSKIYRIPATRPLLGVLKFNDHNYIVTITPLISKKKKKTF